MKFRAIATAAITGIAGLSLVGAGVHAAAGPSQHQLITNQGLSVVLSANGATGNYTPNISLGSFGPTSSSFMTAPTLITITNNGTMTASEVALRLSDQSKNTILEPETWMCLYSDGSIFANEPLTTVKGYGQTAIGNLTLAPGATNTYTVVYYAGATENTGCGNAFTGRSATPYNGYSGQYNSTERYPTGTTNSAATSLTNPAESGTLTPTVTVSYIGVAGTITQIAPFGQSKTVASTASAFGDQLAVTGSSGSVTYVVTSSNSHLKVTGRGVITTVGGPLAVGTYTVSGTDSDTSADTGTWTYTLTVTKGTITCKEPHGRTMQSSHWGDFDDQLSESGSYGTPTYTVTSSDDNLHVSSDGKITTYGARLAPGTYSISGKCKDSYGDIGAWSYTLTVSK